MTTGAGNDIERATDLARKMVCEWGMSEKLGPMTFGKKEEQIFLGRDFTQLQDYSESTAVQIDREVRRLILEAYERAKGLLRANLRGPASRWRRRCSSANRSTAPTSTRSSGSSAPGRLKSPEPVAAAAS